MQANWSLIIKGFLYLVVIIFAIQERSWPIAVICLLLPVIDYIYRHNKPSKPTRDDDLTPLNNLLTYCDEVTIKSLVNFGIWEYRPSTREFTLSPKCSELLNLDNPTVHLSLEDFLDQIHQLDRSELSKRLDSDLPIGHLFFEVRSSASNAYYQWLRFEGQIIQFNDDEKIYTGRLVNATGKVIIKRIQREGRELLTDVIEHRDLSQTLVHICRVVSQIEPNINCVIFLNSDIPHRQKILHSPDLSYSFQSILQTVTLTDNMSELQFTYQKQRSLYIQDLHRLKSWRSIEQIDIKEHIKTFIGQSIISNDNKIQGAVCLYMPNDEIELEVLEVFLAAIHKIASIAIEDQLQADTKEKIQQQLYHSQKMDTIGHLTGGIAHDFNNILGSIVGYNSLARKVATKLEHEKLNGYVNEVGIAAERARELINQMMTYSRSEPVQKTLIDPQLVIKEVLQLVRSMIPTSINIKSSYSKYIPQIKVNPISLHQVVLNHLINAKDAIKDEKGTIHIHTFPAVNISQICRSCKERFEGNYVAIEISDDGIGIPTEMLDKIFDPFFTTKDIGRGTGMGLSVVHGILHDVKAHVTVRSKQGEGSTFTIYFPEATEAETDKIINEPLIGDRDTRKGSGQHIIVVDDDVPLSLLMEEILKSNGYQVSRFDNAQAALAVYLKAPENYDLILTDQTMPDMTGDEMARQMIAKRPELPIIVCTGFSQKLTQTMAQEIGIRKVLKKPVDLHELLEIIAKQFVVEISD